MNPLATQLERKPRRDRGTRRGHPSTSSSTFDQPSSSHLNDDDDDDDGNDEGTSRASTPSPIRYVNSLTNQVPQGFQNPPNIDPHLEPFYTCQIKIINCQVQLRNEQRGGVRSLKIVMENPNHLNEPNEAIPEVNPVVPEPNQVMDIHDPNEMGDKTPPPGDVSSDSVSSDSESEDEEVDVAPEATAGTITQKPYATRTFPRAPWALRRDLEASRARAREMDAKWGTCQTEIALLKSKNKIREK
ncbi:hypothetical protein Tco_0537641 [Tanacetum coccineum]